MNVKMTNYLSAGGEKSPKNFMAGNIIKSILTPSFFYQGYFQKKIDLIKRLIKSQKPEILDVGCGWGQFLEIVRKNNLPYKGIDVSANAVEICRAKKLNCQQLTIEALAKKEKNRYLVIAGFQTIEHLVNPFAFLKAARTLLKKGGLILLTTPNNDSPLRYLLGRKWSVYDTKSHFVFYNKQSLLKTITMSGFKNPQVKIDDWRLMSLGYVFSRLNEMHPRSRPSPFYRYMMKLSTPVLTDPFGNLKIIGFKI